MTIRDYMNPALRARVEVDAHDQRSRRCQSSCEGARNGVQRRVIVAVLMATEDETNMATGEVVAQSPARGRNVSVAVCESPADIRSPHHRTLARKPFRLIPILGNNLTGNHLQPAQGE